MNDINNNWSSVTNSTKSSAKGLNTNVSESKKSQVLTWCTSFFISAHKSGIIVRKYHEKSLLDIFKILPDAVNSNTVPEGIREFTEQFIVNYNNLGCWIKLVLTTIIIGLLISLIKSQFKKIIALKKRGDFKKIPAFLEKVRGFVSDIPKFKDKIEKMYIGVSNRLKCDGHLILGVEALKENCYSGIRVEGIRKIKRHPACSDSGEKKEIVFSKKLTLIAEACENAIYITGPDISDSTDTHSRKIRIDQTPQKVIINKREYIFRVY